MLIGVRMKKTNDIIEENLFIAAVFQLLKGWGN
jgi:hypothetical protein